MIRRIEARISSIVGSWAACSVMIGAVGNEDEGWIRHQPMRREASLQFNP
jgi:hypothetical protein